MAADFLSAVLMTVMTAAPEAAGAATQTIKSIDRQGSVSYAAKPAETSQVIQDRVSVIGPDPYFAKAAADMRERERLRAEYEERDWQRRLQALTYMQSVPSFAGGYDPYPSSWGYDNSYYYPTYAVPVYRSIGRSVRVGYPAHPVAPARPPHVSPPHVSHHASTSRGGGRGR